MLVELCFGGRCISYIELCIVLGTCFVFYLFCVFLYVDYFLYKMFCIIFSGILGENKVMFILFLLDFNVR